MDKKCFKAFTRLTRQNYFSDIEREDNLTEQFNIVQRIPGAGCVFEFMISFYNINGRESARVEIFNDAFIAFENNNELFKCLAHTESITPNELHSLLLKIGYKDVSDYRKAPKEEVYVCYVQNYFGLIDGEDVVEHMRVYSNQGQIDKWFCEQVERGKKEGFEPAEITEDFIGMNDYELTMTSKNKDGTENSFGIVCRPFEIEK